MSEKQACIVKAKLVVSDPAFGMLRIRRLFTVAISVTTQRMVENDSVCSK